MNDVTLKTFQNRQNTENVAPMRDDATTCDCNSHARKVTDATSSELLRIHATASLDGTIRIWSVIGSLVSNELTKHNHGVVNNTKVFKKFKE